MAKKTHQFGILAEKVVLVFLFLKGYRLLFWRYKTKCGEIDIIAKKGNLIAVVEVKARKHIVTIEEVLHPHQVSRIKKATELFLIQNPQYQKYSIRFDFVLLNRFFRLKHFKNHW